METLGAIDSLIIRQEKRFGDRADLFGQGFTNQYSICTPKDERLFTAAERTGTQRREAVRKLYKRNRPFEVEIHNVEDKVILKVVRSEAKRFFHQISIINEIGDLLGEMHREFNPIKRRYILKANGFPGIFLVSGSILHPHDFIIEHDRSPVGMISKVLETKDPRKNRCDDQFAVRFSKELDPRLELVFLGAVFLLDFIYFERH